MNPQKIYLNPHTHQLNPNTSHINPNSFLSQSKQFIPIHTNVRSIQTHSRWIHSHFILIQAHFRSIHSYLFFLHIHFILIHIHTRQLNRNFSKLCCPRHVASGSQKMATHFLFCMKTTLALLASTALAGCLLIVHDSEKEPEWSRIRVYFITKSNGLWRRM